MRPEMLRVIPVIDVLNGVVVHAVKGNRQKYQPLQSVLTTSVNPLDVATVFKRQGFSELYIADLDAILENKPNFALYSGLVQIGFNLLVDAGITAIETAKKLYSYGVSKIIIGTETLPTISFVNEIIQQISAEHIIISLDMKDNKILTPHNFSDSTEMSELLKQLCRMSVTDFILLDLSRVGSNEGVNIDLLTQISTILTHNGNGGRVYVGGGIQSLDELLSLKKFDVLGVLLATALHSGKIDINTLKQTGLLF
ncbi:MAG: HisA/HisF-related TIM barrel protein [Candidatus Bathyarchaeota archaeon]|uniref:HisA/HisF-related TIM barrel protein n=2 Tax=Candidatus Bathycorpusculum sp. TaxID=2994959 RepID=UPI002830C9DC|nr:HisA/HisF-related TIM barrel protein [Candidatus Termiticorpusculum sp.]MCL2292757.1 HisA/HisF-related TIM barrel protein [Candidatus Termiticorpusculum sp.]